MEMKASVSLFFWPILRMVVWFISSKKYERHLMYIRDGQLRFLFIPSMLLMVAQNYSCASLGKLGSDCNISRQDYVIRRTRCV